MSTKRILFYLERPSCVANLGALYGSMAELLTSRVIIMRDFESFSELKECAEAAMTLRSMVAL